MNAPTLTGRIREFALGLGFDAVGVTAIEPSEHARVYREWIEDGHHGEMQYLERPDAVEKRLDPASAWPQLRSAVVAIARYDRDSDATADADASNGIVARYARGRDYHSVLKARLIRLLDFVETEVGRDLPAARAYVDTGPVLERELARRAGLGWFGRNTMLIHPDRGSYFFLACLLVELDLEFDSPFESDHCGTCNACVEACPTNALLGRDAAGAPIIDARLCISYLTIEQRGAIPIELRPLVGNRIFGCDICQEVCPWNEGRGSRSRARARRADGPDLFAREPVPGVEPADAPSLIRLMAMDEEQWERFSQGSAIRRARRAGFLRNVAVALGNARAGEAVPVLTEALSDAEPLVRGHAAWALGEIASTDALASLLARLVVESDEFVRSELDRAVVRARRDSA